MQRAAARVRAVLHGGVHKSLAWTLLPPLLAAGLQWTLWPLVRPNAWLLLYPAVFMSSWTGGLPAGVVATALCIVLARALFVPLQAAGSQASLFATLVFAAAGLGASVVHEHLRRAEERCRALFQHAGDGILITDRQGRCTDANEAAGRLLGRAPGEIVGRAVVDLFHPDDAPRLREARTLLRTSGTHVAEWLLQRQDGSYVPVEITATILPGGRWQAFVRDITERRRVQARLVEAAAVFESTNEGILVADANHRITAVNPAFTHISGFEAHELIGANPRLQQSGRHDAEFYRRFWDELETRGQWQGEVWNRRKNGEVYPVWENVSAIRDAQGRVTHYVAVLSDITSIKRTEERLEHLANHDALTGLPNRLLFANSLEQSMEYAKRHREKMALLFIDLDRFKVINDSMGHAAGDALLQEIGRRLRAAVRAEDVVTRFGGDEFTVALAELARPDEAATVARSIIKAIALPLDLGGREVVVSGSIGIALYPDDGDSVDSLTRAADAAMYRAKQHGRNTFEFYTRDTTERVLEHLALENDLRAAPERGQLCLCYQPVFEPRQRRILGVEALMRWQHPGLGLIMPEHFVPVAERSALIDAIGAWAFGQACAQARTWLDAGRTPVRIAVNLAGRQIVHEHLVEAVESALRASGLPAPGATLEVELPESVFQQPECAGVVLRRLRDLGVRVTIDDFGAGYSSASLLKRLPVDTLKIDRRLVRALPDDADSRAIISAIISMARALGLRVVAKGIETEAQLAFLCEAGCDEVQGWLLGKAESPQITGRLLEPPYAGRGQPLDADA